MTTSHLKLPGILVMTLGLVSVSLLTVSTGSQVAPGTSANLIDDPRFERGVSGFTAQDASSRVTQSAESPLEGAYSLRVAIADYGNNVWWTRPFAGGRASRFAVSAHLRADAASTSRLRFCAMAYFADATTALECAEVASQPGDRGVVSAELALDPERRLESVRLRLVQEGAAPIAFTLDEAVATLDVVEVPTDSGGTPDGGGSGGGGDDSAPSCKPSPTSRYPGFSYSLPAARPYIPLTQYAQAERNSSSYSRFKAAADAALAGDPPYAYSATHSVVMHRITGSAKYINDAIARVEAFVAKAEATIAAGGRPEVSGDSYLEVGWYLEQLALTYDAGYNQLTGSQRQRWPAFAEQTLKNVWNPAAATWGGVSHPWSGWSTCDPGNNYHFSFLRATMLWALASQSREWLDFLQTQKFGPLVDYYAQLDGGGSREGTGYGTAQKNLFENYLDWRHATGEDLAALSDHTRETIDYWVHATVPTRDRFAPIGDQSRSSVPALYDYHENLVHTAAVLSQGTDEAKRGTWWLRNNSVNGVANTFNLFGDLLPYPDQAVAPSALVYHAVGAGALFARSSWATDAAWVAIVAGKFDQSHAHQDQGSFTFFQRDWLAVTANIWSHSGINSAVAFHNVVRFERPDGTTIPQSASDTVQSRMTSASSGGIVTVTADLGNAYWRHQDAVQSWTRTFEFRDSSLRVTDACRVADGVRPVFQLHVPALPERNSDGSVRAGQLLIIPGEGAAVTWSAMPAPEFSKGYRLELRPAAGCSFSVELRAR